MWLKRRRTFTQFAQILNREYLDFEWMASKYSNLNETGFSEDIVPDIVHMVRFENHFLDFVTYISIKSILKNHKPKQLYIHCDCDDLKGKYWDLIDKSIITVRNIERPKFIFGQKLSSVFHASDVTRIKVLMDFGGIFVDNDVFVVKSLKPFLKFEFAIGWPMNDFLGTQVLVAHRSARFLKLWFDSYKDYKPFEWYYNAGELPTNNILKKNPRLVHRVPEAFGVHNLVDYLYNKNVPENEWKSKFYAIHLLERHRSYLLPKQTIRLFNEHNIYNYSKTFGSMARSVLT
ncbi:uncharacterized protein B4U80_07413 [Leptotrombidium deliense]|uniref:Uncharacterized protein n=1 Tax=Leptotrombidium deliense TaxID=299467 RepID=A0A443SD03_9ACAR|nr:uncharacterized protein B4U80_07413 [Leptotrombidium deliense]